MAHLMVAQKPQGRGLLCCRLQAFISSATYKLLGNKAALKRGPLQFITPKSHDMRIVNIHAVDSKTRSSPVRILHEVVNSVGFNRLYDSVVGVVHDDHRPDMGVGIRD